MSEQPKTGRVDPLVWALGGGGIAVVLVLLAVGLFSGQATDAREDAALERCEESYDAEAVSDREQSSEGYVCRQWLAEDEVFFYDRFGD